MIKKILAVEDLKKSYFQASEELIIFQGVNFTMLERDIIALVGPSGSGKSSLLNILGMLDSPTAGKLYLNNHDVSDLNDFEQTKIRGKNIGFVFQFHHLFPDFTAVENVMLPLKIHGMKHEEAKSRASELLSSMKLGNRLNNFPSQLSGGEQQRVSIARAMIMNPRILIADEPTGNLDFNTAKIVFNMLLDLVQTKGVSIILATHDLNIASQIPHKMRLEDQALVRF